MDLLVSEPSYSFCGNIGNEDLIRSCSISVNQSQQPQQYKYNHQDFSMFQNDGNEDLMKVFSEQELESCSVPISKEDNEINHQFSSSSEINNNNNNENNENNNDCNIECNNSLNININNDNSNNNNEYLQVINDIYADDISSPSSCHSTITNQSIFDTVPSPQNQTIPLSPMICTLDSPLQQQQQQPSNYNNINNNPIFTKKRNYEHDNNFNFIVNPPKPNSNNNSIPNYLKLQIVSEDYRFSLFSPAFIKIKDLKERIFKEFSLLFEPNCIQNNNPLHFSNIELTRLQDQYNNDLSDNSIVYELLNDLDSVYAVIPKFPIVYFNLFPELAPQDLIDDINRSFKKYKTTNNSNESSMVNSPYQSPPTQFDSIIPNSPSIISEKLTKKSCNNTNNSNNTTTTTRCYPYCEVTQPFQRNCECSKCHEIRPHILQAKENEKNLCTKWCVTSQGRKQKITSFEFCSICLSRFRLQKYTTKQSHQCTECQRPWMILVSDGKCRRCVKEKERQLKATAFIAPVQVQTTTTPAVVNNNNNNI